MRRIKKMRLIVVTESGIRRDGRRVTPSAEIQARRLRPGHWAVKLPWFQFDTRAIWVDWFCPDAEMPHRLKRYCREWKLTVVDWEE
ncbi:hypothetical protein [Stratiformator vulcanicus]|uniref:Uncharacterized protein n=1 Tax=Stratiformator vulcanicus TaxID=2527980 RepID=A0A517R799_9PLAN|nr:hypothetical protein [Stratiformator vulcanicus]QDT39759.1 hypothetical protein Pan189_41680 [Stratiformator vulcanicus]